MIKPAIILTLLAICTLGCANERNMNRGSGEIVPRTAMAVREGAGRIHFTATDNGVVYLIDVQSGGLLLSSAIKKNERFILDPQSYVVSIEGLKISEKPFNRRQPRRLYFDPLGTAPKPDPKAAS